VSYADQLNAEAIKMAPITNAEALALLDSFGTLDVPEEEYDREFENMSRLRLAAHGYRLPGDKFATADNAAHYRDDYPMPRQLMQHLHRRAVAADKQDPEAGMSTLVAVDQDVVDGKPAAIAQDLAFAWSLLKGLRDNGIEPLPPGSKPGKPKPRQVEDDADVEPGVTVTDLPTSPPHPEAGIPSPGDAIPDMPGPVPPIPARPGARPPAPPASRRSGGGAATFFLLLLLVGAFARRR